MSGRERRHCRDQLMAEFPSDDRADLGNLLDGTGAIQPGHQQIAQRGWYCYLAGVAGVLVAVACILEPAGFQDRLREFLEEERHSVGLGQDLPEQVIGQRLAAGQALNHRGALRARQL